MGLIDVYRINPADQFSVFSPSLKKTQEITYYTLLAKIRGDLNITGTSGNVDNWNEAYDQTIMSGVVTGYTTKTITLTRRDGTEISFDFQDLSPASEDTLDMVTTRGNSTVNIINVGGVSTPWLDLDTSYTGTTEVGRFSWNLDNATADLGLNDNVVLKVGQDDMWYVRNESGSAIPRGTAVMAVGTVGASGRILVSPMVANGSVAAKYLLGITSEEIADDADGYVLAKGNLREFNTSAYTAGQVLWCSPTTPGALTSTEPSAPNLKLPIAFVVHADAEGMLAVRVTAGSTLSENNQVQFGTLANNDVLTYVSANGRWQNVPISTIASTLAFSTIAVTGQPSIVAETNQDTLNIASGTGISLTTNASTDTLTITNTAPDQIVSLTGTGTTTITGTYPNFTINSDDQYDGTVTSVALTAPSAFTVTGSPITTSGTLALGAAGTASQYIRGDGQLADFPTSGGGGSSVSYYLNGSVNQGTFGGNTYYEFNKTPVIGAGTDFSISADGYIAQFITDANDPSLLEIPGGNWNVEFWFSASSSGGTPSFYVELSKYNGTTFTPIASSSGTPEFIAFGTTISQYYTALAVPQTTLAITDRLAIRVYVIHSGRTITLHTENSHLCQVITTFSNGLIALNGLTKQVQYFATGTSGTDFNISSSVDTHTFNIPTASSINRGALSSADWITFNSKADFSFKTIAVAGQSSIVADAADDTLTVVSGTGITLTTNSSTDTLTITNNAPDQTVILTAGTGITTSGTYPSFTITNNDRGSSQNIFKNLAVSGQSTIVADNNDDTLTVASGTGISLTTNAVSDTLTITNTAPDQVVSITAGTGMSVSGTYPSFTVTNTAPDQVVSITGAGTSVVTGTYPNFTITSNDQYVGTVTSVNLTAGTGITVSGGPIISSGSITVNNSDRGSSQNIFKNIAVPGQTTIVASTNNDTFTIKPGSGMSATTLGNDITLSNTDPGSSQNIFKNIAVAGQNTIVADSNNDTLSFVAGTGISLTTNDTTDSLTVTNSAPDQVVALSSGTGISVSGTYPNFTITNTSPSSGGTVTGTGTTNYVTKWTTSSNIGDSQIFDNGTNVGIGTTSPGAKLDVNNGANSEMRLTTSASGILQVGQFTNGAYIGTTSSNATAGILRLGTNSSERIRIDVNGNVGIGTTSPTTRLDIAGAHVGSIGLLRLNSSAGNISAQTYYIDGVYKAAVYASTDNNFYLWGRDGDMLFTTTTSNTERMRITSAGNVGIGTTSPQAPLHVIAASNSNDALIQEWSYTSATVDTYSLMLKQTVTSGVVRYNFSMVNNNVAYNDVLVLDRGNVGIGTTSPSYLLDVNGSGRIGSGIGTGVYVGNTSHAVWTRAGGTNGNMALYSGGSDRITIVGDNGNVGIGTTSPNQTLEVKGADSSTVQAIFQANAGALVAYNGGIQLGNATGNQNSQIYHSSSGDNTLTFASNYSAGTGNKFIFAPGGTERVRFLQNGNVGIGTTSPAEKLHVSGKILQNNGGSLYIDANATNTILASVGARDVLFEVNSANRLIIGSSGTIRFNNYGSGSKTGTVAYNLAVDSSGNIIETAGGVVDGTGTANYVSKWSDANTLTNSVLYDDGTNVGIGTTAPNGKLQVDGDFYVNGLDRKIMNYNGAVDYGTLTNNSVRFNQNGVERARISTTGNVGIGTTSPGYKLEVNGTGRFNGELTVVPSSTNGVTVSRAGGYASIYGSNDLVFETDGVFYFGVYTPRLFSVNSSFYTTAGGNVGIGTASPSYKLDVRAASSLDSFGFFSGGSGGTKGGIYLGNNGSQYGSLWFDNSSNDVVLRQNYVTGNLIFGTNSTERVRITSSGNVGIGTTSPNERLTVIGKVYAIPYLPVVISGNGSPQYGTNITMASDTGATQGAVRIWSKYDGSGNAAMTFERATTTQVYNADPQLLTYSESMRISGNGNVGIGTTGPSDKLHIVGDINVGVYKVYNGSSNNSAGFELNGSRFNIHGYYGITFNSSSAGIGSQIERMRITPAGNVGIGTTSPYGRLELSGSGQSWTTAPAIRMWDSFNSKGWLIGNVNNITAGDFYIRTLPSVSGDPGSGQQEFTIKHATGNVGIGTTSPATKLVVNGGGFAVQGDSTPPSSGYGLEIWNSSTTSYIGSYNRTTSAYRNTFLFANDTIFENGGAERMRITAAGNVGIGTTSPGQKLSVEGGSIQLNANNAASNYYLILNKKSGQDGGVLFNRDNSGDWQLSNNASSGDLIFYSYGTSSEAITFKKASGNVGIGTTSPGAKLEIAGTTSTLALSFGNSVPNNPLFINTYGGFTGIGMDQTTAGLRLVGDFGGNDLVDVGYYSSNVVAHANWVSRMCVLGSGNVGIGTTSPTYKFNVVSNAVAGKQNLAAIDRTAQNFVTFTNPQYSTDASMGLLLRVFPQSDARQGAGIIASGGSNNATTDLDLFVTTSPDGLGGTSYSAIKINGLNGNVGIGTTSPASRLHVETSSSNPFRMVRTGGSATNFGYEFGSGAIGLYDYTNSTYRYYITSGGNVGIGTTSPGSKLTVIGDIATSTRVASDTINGYTGGSTPLTIQTGGAQNLIIGTNNTERIRVTTAGDVGIGTTSPSAKLHVIGNATVSATLSTAHAKITGTLADSFGLVGTAGQVLSSTGTGIEWVTGGGGGGGSTIIVKDEGTTIGSSFTTLDFVGNNIQASASGSTAVVTAYNNAGTGSIYANDTATQYAPPASFSNVEINSLTVEASAPDTAGTSQKLIAIVTFGVDNVSTFDGFNNFDFRLYNFSGSTAVPDTTHSWCSYMSKGEFEKRTVFTFHIPLYDGVGGSDVIRVQAKQSTAYTPEIYYCALTLIEGTN